MVIACLPLVACGIVKFKLNMYSLAHLALTLLKFVLILLLSDVLPVCSGSLSGTSPSLISLHTQDLVPWDHTPTPSPRTGHVCFLWP